MSCKKQKTKREMLPLWTDIPILRTMKGALSALKIIQTTEQSRQESLAWSAPKKL